MRRIGVPIELYRGARKFGAGMNTGVRQFIDEDQIVGADQSRNDAGIGEVARTEHTSGRAALEPRQPRFERRIEWMITGNEARSAGADAVTGRRIERGGDHLGMLAEIE